MGRLDPRMVTEPEDLLRAAIDIDENLITEEYQRLPGDLAYYNAQLAQATRAYLAAKRAVEKTEARLTLKYGHSSEAHLKPEGWKKPNDAIVDALVQEDEEMEVAAQLLIEAEAERARLIGVVEAVRAKREMIVSLGAHLRIELQGDPILREQAASRHYTRTKP